MARRIGWFSSVLVAAILTTSAVCAEGSSADNNTTTAAAPAAASANSDVGALVRILTSKGVLTQSEASSIESAPASDQMKALVDTLKSKGVLTSADMDALGASTSASSSSSTAATTAPSSSTSTAARSSTSTLGPGQQAPATAEKPAPPSPTVVQAVAPVRPLPIDPPKREGLIPGIKLGPATLTPYGFIKATVAVDSSSPRGDDFPLPGFLGDTGPNPAPEFHIKARSTRIGANFEWPDISKKMVLTGRIETDFEGNFSRADNRNISAIRSSMLGIRQAWVRLDYNVTDSTSLLFLGGQDWTPFGSSTLPNLLETTGLGIGFGTLYERSAQFRFGVRHKFPGSRKFTIAPEVAIVNPAFGNTPADIASAVNGPNGILNVVTSTGVGNQLGYGERQGADSERPEVEGRVVFQWQLDRAQGVAPAQIIVSGTQGHREAVVLASAIPAAFKTAFPTGARVGSDRYGISFEAQLPTRFLTVTAKFYRGADLRYYFAGQLFSNYNNDAGFTGITPVPSVDGSSTLVFGTDAAGNLAVAHQRPVRTEGGFVNLGLPLSRWFHADPKGHNAGWQMYLHAGTDQVLATDLRHVLGANGGRARSGLGAATLYYKFNQWCTFAYEQSWYRTVAVPNTLGVYPVVSGRPARTWTDHREEFGPIFTF